MTLGWSPRRWLVAASCLSSAILLSAIISPAMAHPQPATPAPSPSPAAAKPRIPLSSDSRWIVDTAGGRVKLRCINWAGHMEVNVPEGLDKTTVEAVADWIAGEGFNCVRLTYSIDMALRPDVRVRDSFRQGAKAAGVEEAAVMALHDRAVAKNPFLADGGSGGGGAAVIDVFGRVVAALWDRGVMTVLDNHVSRAGWCCNLDDGNGWWADEPIYAAVNSQFFNPDDWLAGLRAMADWSRGRAGVVAMSLRNEPRALPLVQSPFAPRAWQRKMAAAAAAVHDANPDLLVVVAGLAGGTDLTPVRSISSSSSSSSSSSDDDDDDDDASGNWLAPLPPSKRVWESHAYSFTPTTPNFGNCPVERAEIGALYGFVLEQGKPYTAPLFMSEFGVDMAGGGGSADGGLSRQDADYLACLVGWLDDNDADWALWAVQGSYYIREGRVDWDESWGALDFNWTGWRNPQFKGMLGKMFEVSQGPLRGSL